MFGNGQNLERQSVIDTDLKTTQWMCENGFDGYANRGISRQGSELQFHSEVALCPSALVKIGRLPLEYRFNPQYPSCYIKTMNGRVAELIPRTEISQPLGYKNKEFIRSGKNKSDAYQQQLTEWERKLELPNSFKACREDSDKDKYTVKYQVS